MRFLHKFSSINYEYFCLVNGLLLRAKKKSIYTKTLDYLSKYEYILDTMNIMPKSTEYEDKIWQCWFQGKDKMPEIVKKCTDSVSRYYGDKVIFLEDNKLNDYIELPDYIIEKHNKGIIPNANFSDICRLFIIAKYGGTWIDSTIYLTDKIPEDILSADFFTFRSRYTDFLPFINDLKDFKMYCNNFNTPISIESPYFISAKPGNPIINGVLNLFLEYWKHENKLREYLMIDKFFIITVLHNKEYLNQFLNMPKYYLENVLLLHHVMFEKFDQSLYDNITRINCIHKLTHKNLHRNIYKNSFLNHILK